MCVLACDSSSLLQGRVGILLYIAVTLLFLLMTVIAEATVGGEVAAAAVAGGRWSEEGGGRGLVREAGRCSARRVRPDS